MEQNKKLLSIYPLPTLLTHLPLITCTTQEITGRTNEAAKGANKAPRNLPSCFFLCFTVSVTPSINISQSFNDFIISISSFEINKVNPFLHCKLLFLLFLFQIYLMNLKLNCLLIQVNDL